MTKRELYDEQMSRIKILYDKNAITKEQYVKSSKDLTEKMGFGEWEEDK